MWSQRTDWMVQTMLNKKDETSLAKNYIEDQTSARLGGAIPPYMLQAARSKPGVFFGIRQSMNATYYIGKPQDVDGHILVVGGAGSGKSSCIAIPTLRLWGGTFFAVDIKGELLQYAAAYRKSDYPVKVFNFSKEHGTNLRYSRYDPFYLLREDSKDNLVQNAREIAQAIIPILPNAQEPFWSQAAQNILTAVILYVCGLKEFDEASGRLLEGSFNDAMELIQTVPIWGLIEKIVRSGNKAAIMHINQFRSIEFPEDNKMLAGISAELSNRVIAFATDNRLKAAFTNDDRMMRWEDLESHNIIMRIPEDKLDQWDGAITLMLTQLIRTLEQRPDKYSGGKCPPPVLLLLDEFPRLGKIDVIQNAVSTLRSKGVTICVIVQSLAQLDKIYGKESRQIILDNCPYKALLSVTDPETQRMFSDMIGTINVSKKGISDSSSRSMGKSRGSSMDDTISFSDGQSRGLSRSIGTNMSTVREPIVFPHELAALKDILLLTPDGFCRVNKLPYYIHPLV